jgi:phenylalanyl-tRNA synthetase beta chain
LPVLSPSRLAHQLTYYGLETNLVKHKGNPYLEFVVLPNRPDLLSWQGIIAEIGILLNCQVKPLTFPPLPENRTELIKVAVETSKCQEFHLGLIRNIKIKESPSWLKENLEVNNIHSINNLIDTVNWIMLETGQPLHIFDYDTLPKKEKITIRQVQTGETLTTLHGQKLELTAEDIVVNSEEKIISLAGIIGTQETSLSPQSQNILIESASFSPQTIKKTAKRLNISTRASQLFSRGTNLLYPPKMVLRRAIFLIIQSYQGDLNSGMIFPCQESPEKKKLIITISQEFITKKIGQKIPEKTIEEIWQQLNFSYQKKGNIYQITIPPQRPDITIAEDLLEELLKIYDYNKITGSLP